MNITDIENAIAYITVGICMIPYIIGFPIYDDEYGIEWERGNKMNNDILTDKVLENKITNWSKLSVKEKEIVKVIFNDLQNEYGKDATFWIDFYIKNCLVFIKNRKKKPVAEIHYRYLNKDITLMFYGENDVKKIITYVLTDKGYKRAGE